MENQEDKLTTLYGRVMELTTPSGYKVTIREQNGADDDIISNVYLAKTGESLNAFVANIVVKSDLKQNSRLNAKDVAKMKVRDKYFILIASRIHSLGNLIKFKYDWGEGNEPTTYVEDLTQYIWDYSKEFPNEDSEEYSRYRITPYETEDTYREIKLTSGKEIRYDFLTGEAEGKLLEIPQDKLTKNSQLVVRNLQLKNAKSGEWDKVQNFQSFSMRDMAEIRNDVNSNDAPFDCLSEIEHPTNGMKMNISLVAVEDFFFPVEI